MMGGEARNRGAGPTPERDHSKRALFDENGGNRSKFAWPRVAYQRVMGCFLSPTRATNPSSPSFHLRVSLAVVAIASVL